MTAFLAVLLLAAIPAGAQTITTVNENLATSSNTFYFNTDRPLLSIGATFYSGPVPSVELNTSSNVVIGSCVVYATGTVNCNGINLSTAGAGPFAPVFVGISSGPSPAGTYLATATWSNGVLTGGGFVTLPSGGAGTPSTMTITAVSDNFLGSVTGSQKNFTLSNTPANAAALSCYLDGLLISQTSDYIYTPPSSIAVTTAPAANSTGFFCNYFVNTSTLPAVFILSSTQTVSGSNNFTQKQTFSGQVSLSTYSCVNLAYNAYTYAHQAMGPAITGSTVSFVVQAGTVTVDAVLPFALSGGCSFGGAIVLVDGAFGAGGGVLAPFANDEASNLGDATFSIHRVFSGLTAGVSHSFSISVGCNPDTGTIKVPSGSGSNTYSPVGQVCAYEFMGK